ncbi:MAG: histidinol-phosphatase HisJ family protein [Candidatus Vecturithrix sp.]|jgi:histidinol-phosphatase (PHP family)|nr:histidinol-phosphatase HisJ family protein [Candidatus Vecturithrix sp.]
MIDYHIHTKLCGHAFGEMEDFVQHAVRVGLQEIGFSDHLPMIKWANPEYAMAFEQLPEYIQEVHRLQQAYPHFSLKLGIEADYYSHNEEQALSDLLSQYPFDYVYGSVHFVNGWAIDDARNFQRWEESDIDQIYEQYFTQLQCAASSDLVDIISHTDLVKKFGHRPSKEMTPLIEETIRVYKQHGMVVEINSSGLRKPVNEIYPAPHIIQLLKEYDVPIVFGSDAHKPEEVGQDFEYLRTLVKDCGYKELVILTQREIVNTYPL